METSGAIDYNESFGVKGGSLKAVNLESWEAELATDFMGGEVIYKSDNRGSTESIIINSDMGSFTGSLRGKTHLTPGLSISAGYVRKALKNGGRTGAGGTSHLSWKRISPPSDIQLSKQKLFL